MNAISQHRRAIELERTGSFDDALSACEAALALAPHMVDAWLTRGSLHAATGDRVTAIECFRRVTAIAPERAVGHHLLASVGGAGFDSPLRGEVADLFDAYADRYDDHLLEELGYRGHELLPAAVRDVTGVSEAGWTTYDLGCGTGLCGTALRPLSESLMGVDLSEKCLDKARELGTYDFLLRADLVYALAMAPRREVDLIVAADVFSYLGDLAAVAEESVRALRPGGRLAFSVEASEDAHRAMTAARRVTYSDKYLRTVAEVFGMEVEIFETHVVRTEAGRDVKEHLVVLRAS
jgi:predicted TPR repeat methyltransferase